METSDFIWVKKTTQRLSSGRDTNEYIHDVRYPHGASLYVTRATRGARRGQYMVGYAVFWTPNVRLECVQNNVAFKNLQDNFNNAQRISVLAFSLEYVRKHGLYKLCGASEILNHYRAINKLFYQLTGMTPNETALP